MEEQKLSFSIPVKQRTTKPLQKQLVSNVFAKPKVATKQNAPIAHRNTKISSQPKKDKQESVQLAKESSFLRMLKRRKQGIPPPKPVPTKNAINPDVPVSGFGELALLKQGWEPGMKIGEVVANEETVRDTEKK